MADMIFGFVVDIIGEILAVIPFVYRIWGLLVSKKYREKVKAEYKEHSGLYVVFDIIMSLIFFGIECYFIWWLWQLS